MTKYLISFAAILAAVFFVFSSQIDVATAANIKNNQYTEYLTTALHDASKEMKHGMASDGRVLPTEADRERVSDTFFRSLAMDFGYTTQEDMLRLHLYVPAFVMIDNDGYYIAFNDRDGAGGALLEPRISGLNTWVTTADVAAGSASEERYLVRYFLNHDVQVTAQALGITETGNYLDVFEKLGMPDALRAIGFSSRDEHVTINEDGSGTFTLEEAGSDQLSDNDRFFEEIRDEKIISEMESIVSDYINRNNQAASYQDRRTSYFFIMPRTRYDDWRGAIQSPSCIAFLQGIQISNTKEYLNIYAIGGGEVSKGSVYTFTASDTGTGEGRSYVLGPNSDVSGYVPDGKAVAEAGGTPDRKDSETYIHHHWGNPLTGTGCYEGGAPVYRKYSSEDYEVERHVHVDAYGANMGESETVSKTLGGGGCYRQAITHKHRENEYDDTGALVRAGCYQDVFHVHSGSPNEGTGCYTTPVYHVHTAECYGQDTSTSYQPTRNIYHEHIQPKFYYIPIGKGTDTPTYTAEEIAANGESLSDYYIARADTFGSCYEAVYAKSEYKLEGVKRVIVDETYETTGVSTFTAPEEANYDVTAGVYTGSVHMVKGGTLTITLGDRIVVHDNRSNRDVINEEVPGHKAVKVAIHDEIITEFTDTSIATKYEDGETVIERRPIPGADGVYEITAAVKYIRDERKHDNGDGKSLLAQGYVYRELSQTCGKSGDTVESTEDFGSPVTIEEPGQLVCGKTTSTIERYALGCGYIDIYDSNSPEMQAYARGLVSADYILTRGLEEQRLVCGFDEDDIIGWRRSCGKKTGDYEGARIKDSELGKDSEVESYELNCGLQEGETLQMPDSIDDFKNDPAEWPY